VAKLQEGISVVIAPEGTRSLTPTLGEFKTAPSTSRARRASPSCRS